MRRSADERLPYVALAAIHARSHAAAVVYQGRRVHGVAVRTVFYEAISDFHPWATLTRRIWSLHVQLGVHSAHDVQLHFGIKGIECVLD
jgi:hypothetical protein